MLLVIQTASIAAVAIAFANFTGVLAPWFSASAWIWKFGTFGPYQMWFGVLGPYNVGLNTQNLLAILSLLLLTWINSRGVRLGAIVQNVFTFAKIAALCGLTLLGFVLATQTARTANFTDFWRNANFFGAHAYQAGQETVWVNTMTLVGLSMVGALFSSSAWPDITFAAAEVRNPNWNLPLFGRGHGDGDAALRAGEFRLLACASAGGNVQWRIGVAARNSVCQWRSRGNGGRPGARGA